MQEVYKKDSRKAISIIPARQIFEIFTLVPILLVASQGDTKLNKLPAHRKNPG